MTTAIAPDSRVKVKLISYCRTCDVRHDNQDATPSEFNNQAWDWLTKHEGHDIEFLSPSRILPRGLDESPYKNLADDKVPWWLTARHNVDATATIQAEQTLTLRLDLDSGLASSATFVAGRVSTSVTSSGQLDYRVYGFTEFTGAPVAGTSFRTYCIPKYTTSAWPNLFSSGTYAGTHGEYTLRDATFLEAMGFLGNQTLYAADVVFNIIPKVSIANAFGFLPAEWAIFVAHNAQVGTTTTEAEDKWYYRGMKVTIV